MEDQDTYSHLPHVIEMADLNDEKLGYLFKHTNGQLLRPYFFPASDGRGDDSFSGPGFTQLGAIKYIQNQIEKEEQGTEIYKNLTCFFNWDPKCTPAFDKDFLNAMRKRLEASDDGWFIIYRQNHTTSLIKQGNEFLFLDSYNAYGAKDADHIPVLENLRAWFPEGNLSVLPDKTQSDYNNCLIFAVEYLVAVLRTMKYENQSLAEFKANVPSNKIYPEDEKAKEYKRLGIHVLPGTPECIIEFVQSQENALKMAESSHAPEEIKERLMRHIAKKFHKNNLKEMNVNVERRNKEFWFKNVDDEQIKLFIQDYNKQAEAINKQRNKNDN